MGDVIKAVAAILGILILIFAVVIGGDLFYSWYRGTTASFRGGSEAERAIESGQSRIELYNRFFNLCSGVRAKEAAIVTLSKSSMDPKLRQTSIDSNQISRSNLIEEYNALAASSYTAARFKDSGLPERISFEPFVAEHSRTVCK